MKKKLLAFALALTMCLGSGMTANAAMIVKNNMSALNTPVSYTHLTAICHKLLDVFDTRQIIFRCVKFLPFLNIMTVVTYCNSLHNQIFLNFEMGGKPF